MIHFFKQPISHLALPDKFTYPFHYTPHPLCVLAAEEVKEYIASREEWQEELAFGKMFGVLIVQKENKQETAKKEAVNEIGYLAAFSGNLAGKNLHPYFVPPVYDLLQPEGFFKIEEEQISSINIRIRELENNRSYLDLKEKWKTETEQAKAILNQAKAELKAAKEAREIRRQSSSTLSEEEQASLIRESQYQKAEYKRLEKKWKKRLEEFETETRHFETEIEQLKTERKERSAALQRKLFEQFRMLNARGEVKDLYTIFEQTVQKVPRLAVGNATNWMVSDLYVCDGSYLRLKNITLGYTLPKTLTRKLTIERLRVYVQAENLVTWTKYWGFDPEISSGATSLGVDRGIYPQARTYTVGVNVSF